MAEQGKNKKDTKAEAAAPSRAVPPPPKSSAGLDAATAAGQLHGDKHGFRRKLLGKVTSDKMDKTVTVLVERRVMHPLYKKFIRRSKKYAAHDEANLCKEGDLVQIEECPPISKRKAWQVVQRNGGPLAAPQAEGAAA